MEGQVPEISAAIKTIDPNGAMKISDADVIVSEVERLRVQRDSLAEKIQALISDYPARLTQAKQREEKAAAEARRVD